MRAKFINEIRQEIEGSGLGAIGVGKAGMKKAYNYAKANWPKWIEKNGNPMNEKFAKDKFKFLSRMEDKFDISMSDHLWIDWRINLNEVFDAWLKSIKFDKTLAINPSTWDSNDVRVAKYSYEWNMGYLSMSNGIFDDNKVHGYFFKYI